MLNKYHTMQVNEIKKILLKRGFKVSKLKNRHLRGKFKNIICEYNIKPMNLISKKFHEKFGFRKVGSQKTEGGTKEVLMMEYSL